MTDRVLTSGQPVPDDESHRQLKENGQQADYVVLSPEERAKGFVKPVRRSYVHAFPSEINRQVGCGVETRMSTDIAETYARDPHFYSGTFCVGCKQHFPLIQFVWSDGEPMEPSLQEAWNAEQRSVRARAAEERRVNRIAALRRELAELEGQAPVETSGREGT